MMRIDWRIEAVKIGELTLTFNYGNAADTAVVEFSGPTNKRIGRKRLDKVIEALSEFRSELRKLDEVKKRQNAEIAAKEAATPKK